MLTRDIIRAWKDAEYRATLGADALARLPGHPAGWIELADPGLDALVAKGLRIRTSLRAGLGPTRDCDATPGCPAWE